MDLTGSGKWSLQDVKNMLKHHIVYMYFEFLKTYPCVIGWHDVLSLAKGWHDVLSDAMQCKEARDMEIGVWGDTASLGT